MPNLSEGAQPVTITNVPVPVLDAIKKLAEKEQRPLSNFLRRYLEQIVAEHRAKEALARR
jgi:hypothetical protein